MTQRKPRILVTRPMGQHENFARACAELGFAISHLPCLAIQPLHPSAHDASPWLQSSAVMSTQFETVLFTSVNAVNFAHQLLPLPWPEISVHAIGAATARALKSHDQPLAMAPEAPYNSEAYLLQLQRLAPSRLLIIKGVGGRGHIHSHLNDLSWHVETLDVYRRTLPAINRESIDAVFQPDVPDIISVTSNETLENLLLLADDHRELLLQIPLIVNSQRCADLALSRGFIEPARVADPAGDSGQLMQLERWQDTFHTSST